MPDLFLPIAVILLALGSVLWLWALVDCLRNEPSEGNDKIIWILVILFGNAIGAVLYLLIRRPKRIEQYGK